MGIDVTHYFHNNIFYTKHTKVDKDQNLIETDLIIDSTISMHLRETAVWGKFLSIIGFVYCGLVAMGAIFAASLFAKITGSSVGNSGGILAGGSIAIFYLAIAVVIFFMSMYLFRFAKNTQAAIKANDQDELTTSFKNLKIYFRFAGIITVVTLIFTVLGIIGIMVATAFSRG
jgi:hypothetical protein